MNRAAAFRTLLLSLISAAAAFSFAIATTSPGDSAAAARAAQARAVGTPLRFTNPFLLAGTDPRLAVRNLIDLVTGKPRKGATVQLTINSAAQEAAYKALKATGLPSGAVAIDPRTGAILALASYPSFNPNKLATLNGVALNKADQKYLSSPQQPQARRPRRSSCRDKAP